MYTTVKRIIDEFTFSQNQNFKLHAPCSNADYSIFIQHQNCNFKISSLVVRVCACALEPFNAHIMSVILYKMEYFIHSIQKIHIQWPELCRKTLSPHVSISVFRFLLPQSARNE